ncbi:MAG TPA: NADPH:quinone oxidoreductase family protein [Acidimicrobiia bacterium]|jgi:NADPH2:quinone reductase|nr:NADPH:quinone oxidoreductase family protein [Acidimicrobiia bacterium]
MTMRAMQVQALGGIDQLQLAEVEVPAPGPGQVRVSVQAAGVNFPDILMIAGQYQADPPLPFSPGFEVAGTISALGPDVTGLEVGQRVAATPLWGGYAEEVVVEAAVCAPIPDALESADAAVLPIAFGTAIHALRDRGRLAAGETLLVTGATGGTGSAAVKLGRLMGARVIAAVGSEAKTDLARSMGADDVIVYDGAARLRDSIKAATGGKGADVVFDPVGGEVTGECLRATAWDGRLLIIGFAAGSIPQLPANLPLLKGCSIIGVFWGRWRMTQPAVAHAQFEELAQWVVDGDLDPGVSAQYPLEDARTALKALAQRHVAGKVVLTV